MDDEETNRLHLAFEDLEAIVATMEPEERKHFRELMAEGINRVYNAVLLYQIEKYAIGLRRQNLN